MEQSTNTSKGKLREALLKFAPDEFAKSVFLYSVRIATRVGHYQTYVPSINYLLKHSSILSSTELTEVASIFALHLAHFSNDNETALSIQFKYAKNDIKLQRILRAWRITDYFTWIELYEAERDVLYHRMMEYGADKMIKHSIKCIQKSYFQLPDSYVNQLFHMDLQTLNTRYSCGWELKDKTVVIRTRN